MSDIITNKKKFIKGWKGGLPETPCGHGSLLSSTEKQRAWIPQIIDRYNIKSIVDIGAGDLNWISCTDLRGASYKAYDLVPRRPDVIEFDIVKNPAPRADLVICLWVLNHLPFNSARAAYNHLRANTHSLLMITDRPRYYADAPPELNDPACVEKLILNSKGDSIRLIQL